MIDQFYYARQPDADDPRTVDGVAYVRIAYGEEQHRQSSKFGKSDAWHPEAPCWYVFAVFDDGDEWPIYVGYDEDDARFYAAKVTEEVGDIELIDLSRMGSA